MINYFLSCHPAPDKELATEIKIKQDEWVEDEAIE
jgi:hypothetical protein